MEEVNGGVVKKKSNLQQSAKSKINLYVKDFFAIEEIFFERNKIS